MELGSKYSGISNWNEQSSFLFKYTIINNETGKKEKDWEFDSCSLVNGDNNMLFTTNIINYYDNTDELYGLLDLKREVFIQIYSIYQKALVGQYDDKGNISLTKTINYCTNKLKLETEKSKKEGINNLLKLIKKDN